MAGRGGLTCGLAALIAFVAMAATAEAEFDATDVSAAKVREKSFTPDGVEPVGGSVECPNDGYALAGGAFWREPPSSKPVQPEAAGFPTLSASIPTARGRRLVRPRAEQPGRNPDDSRPLLEGRAFQRLLLDWLDPQHR